MTFTYTLYTVGKIYSDRQLAVIIRSLKVDGRNVRRIKSIIHLPANFLLVTIFIRRYRSFFIVNTLKYFLYFKKMHFYTIKYAFQIADMCNIKLYTYWYQKQNYYEYIMTNYR